MIYDRDPEDSDWHRWDTFLLVLWALLGVSAGLAAVVVWL